MATIIQKAIEGSRFALMVLYDKHKHSPVPLELKIMNNLVTVSFF